jgi:hypothetical protein
MTDRLAEHIKEKGGVWDGERALAFYRSIGFGCTLGRAEANLGMAAEANPDLLTRMPDKRFTWTTEPLDLSGGETDPDDSASDLKMGRIRHEGEAS